MWTITIHLTSECLLKEVLSDTTQEKEHLELIWSKKFLVIENETLARNPTTSTIRSFNCHQWWNPAMNLQMDLIALLMPMVMYRVEETVRGRSELTLYRQLDTVKYIKACQWVQIWLWIKLAAQRAWTIHCLRDRASMKHWSLKSRILMDNNNNKAGLVTTM